MAKMSFDENIPPPTSTPTEGQMRTRYRSSMKGQREQEKLGVGKESIKHQKEDQPQKSSKRAKGLTPRNGRPKNGPTKLETAPISRANRATLIDYEPAAESHTNRSSVNIPSPHPNQISPFTYPLQPTSAAPNDLFNNPEPPTSDADFEHAEGDYGNYCEGLNSTEGVCKDPLFCIKVHKCLACHRKGHGHLHCHKMAHVSSFMQKP